MENNCYVTLVTDERFLPCVIRCAQTLKHFNSIYPYIVMIPEQALEIKKTLIKNNIDFKEIPIEKFQTEKFLYYNDTINKFKLLNFIEFDKICFLDADVILLGNIDNEFKKLTPDKEFYLYGTDFSVITGHVFIARPNINFYNKIFQQSLETPFQHDEEIFNFFFLKDNLLLETAPNKILHFGGQIKAWENVTDNFNFIKSFFLTMNEEEFFYWINEHLEELIGKLLQWSKIYSDIPRHAYSVIVTNNEELEKVILIEKKLKEYGFFFPLIIILTNEDKEIIDTIASNNLPFELIKINKNNLTLRDKLFLNFQVFQENFYSICFIDNLDICIDENFDYLFNRNLSKTIKNKLLNKYKKDFIYLKYR